MALSDISRITLDRVRRAREAGSAPSGSTVRDDFDAASEIRQAGSRIWNVLIAIGYLYLSGMFTRLTGELLQAFTVFILGHLTFIIALYFQTRVYPGVVPLRRLIAMCGDFASLTVVMLLGEELAMPLYGLIVWVTLGNGMRFGQRHLILATFMAQLSILTLFLFSAYWRAQPYLLTTFAFVALVLPAYARLLLRQTAEARDAALTAIQAKSRYLAHASHDLRQPIHAIGYYLDLLRNANNTPDREQLIDRIERAIGSVSRLFKSLLDIGRLDSGTVVANPAVVALQPLLADIVQQNEQSASWNKVELRHVRTSVAVSADPILLTTMIQNLLSNAIKYARGSKVVLGVRRKGLTVAIEVHDAGIGISDEQLPHIFEEFYRAHVEGDHDTEGVGLGLAIVNKLARLSKFSLALKSRRGAGTTAGIYDIPVVIEPPSERAQIVQARPKPLSGYRVILIEDNPDVLAATQALLEQWGCEVQPHLALPTHVEPADLIIADHDLGQETLGTDAITAIRIMTSQMLPAILISGHAEAVIKKQILEVGITVLAKPVQPATLRSMLSSMRITGRDQVER